MNSIKLALHDGTPTTIQPGDHIIFDFRGQSLHFTRPPHVPRIYFVERTGDLVDKIGCNARDEWTAVEIALVIASLFGFGLERQRNERGGRARWAFKE